jgi:hypothetical protein
MVKTRQRVDGGVTHGADDLWYKKDEQRRQKFPGCPPPLQDDRDAEN